MISSAKCRWHCQPKHCFPDPCPFHEGRKEWCSRKGTIYLKDCVVYDLCVRQAVLNKIASVSTPQLRELQQLELTGAVRFEMKGMGTFLLWLRKLAREDAAKLVRRHRRELFSSEQTTPPAAAAAAAAFAYENSLIDLAAPGLTASLAHCLAALDTLLLEDIHRVARTSAVTRSESAFITAIRERITAHRTLVTTITKQSAHNLESTPRPSEHSPHFEFSSFASIFAWYRTELGVHRSIASIDRGQSFALGLVAGCFELEQLLSLLPSLSASAAFTAIQERIAAHQLTIAEQTARELEPISPLAIGMIKSLLPPPLLDPPDPDSDEDVSYKPRLVHGIRRQQSRDKVTKASKRRDRLSTACTAASASAGPPPPPPH